MRSITLLGSFAGLLALGAAVDPTQTSHGLTTQDSGHQTFPSEVSSEHEEQINSSSIEDKGPGAETSPATASFPFPPPVREQSASSAESPIAILRPEPANFEIDLWSFCPAGMLRLLSWAGLCPDHFSLKNVKGVNAIGTTITKTAILEPDMLATRPLTSIKISRPIIWQTETIPIVIITTEESTLLSTTTIPTTKTETRIKTETVTTEAPVSKTTTETKTRTVTEVPTTKTKTEKKTQTVTREVSVSVTSTTSVTRTRTSTEYTYTTEVETLTEVEATPWNLLRTATVTTTVTETPITTPLPSRTTSDLPIWSPRYCGEKAIIHPIGMECELWIKFPFVIHCLQWVTWGVLLFSSPWALCQVARGMAYWVSPRENPDNGDTNGSPSPPPPRGGPPPPPGGPPPGGPPRGFSGSRGLPDINVFKSPPGGPSGGAGRNQHGTLDIFSRRHDDQIPIRQRVDIPPTRTNHRAHSVHNPSGRTEAPSPVDLIPLDRLLDSDRFFQAPSNTSNNTMVRAPAYSIFDKTAKHPRRTLKKFTPPTPLTPETENRPVLILSTANDGKNKDVLNDMPPSRDNEDPINRQARVLIENLDVKVAEHVNREEYRKFSASLLAVLETTREARNLSDELMDRCYNQLLGRHPTLLKDSDIRERMKILSRRITGKAPSSFAVSSQPVADADTNPANPPNLKLVLSRIGNLVDGDIVSDGDDRNQMRAWLNRHGDPKDDREVLKYLYRLQSHLVGDQRDDNRDVNSLPAWRQRLATLIQYPVSDHQMGKKRWDLTYREIQEQTENEDERVFEGEAEDESIDTVTSSSSDEVTTHEKDNNDSANRSENATTTEHTDQNKPAREPEQEARQVDNARTPDPANEPANSPQNQDSHGKDTTAITTESNPIPQAVTRTGAGTAPELETEPQAMVAQLVTDTGIDADADNTGRRNSNTPRQNPLRKNSSSSNVRKKDTLRRVK